MSSARKQKYKQPSARLNRYKKNVPGKPSGGMTIRSSILDDFVSRYDPETSGRSSGEEYPDPPPHLRCGSPKKQKTRHYAPPEDDGAASRDGGEGYGAEEPAGWGEESRGEGTPARVGKQPGGGGSGGNDKRAAFDDFFVGHTGGGAKKSPGGDYAADPGGHRYRTQEGGVNVDVYPDMDSTLDPDAINDIMSKVAGARTVRVPCTLPEDEEDAANEESIREAAAARGEVDDGDCPMCNIGDDVGMDNSVMENIKAMDVILYGKVSDAKLRQMKVDVFNKYVYGNAVSVGDTSVQMWTVFKMKIHEEKCDKRLFERDIMSILRSIRKQKNFLTKNVIFTKAMVGSAVSDKIDFDYKASAHWLKLSDDEVKHMKTLKDFIDYRMVGVPGRGPGSKSSAGTQREVSLSRIGGAREDSDSVYFPCK